MVVSEKFNREANYQSGSPGVSSVDNHNNGADPTSRPMSLRPSITSQSTNYIDRPGPRNTGSTYQSISGAAFAANSASTYQVDGNQAQSPRHDGNANLDIGYTASQPTANFQLQRSPGTGYDTPAQTYSGRSAPTPPRGTGHHGGPGPSHPFGDGSFGPHVGSNGNYGFQNPGQETRQSVPFEQSPRAANAHRQFPPQGSANADRRTDTEASQSGLSSQHPEPHPTEPPRYQDQPDSFQEANFGQPSPMMALPLNMQQGGHSGYSPDEMAAVTKNQATNSACMVPVNLCAAGGSASMVSNLAAMSNMYPGAGAMNGMAAMTGLTGGMMAGMPMMQGAYR
ncbi:hypothetical protein HDE_03169 [Halotydeus destructor]|nr:hypothetical protein HDE_03169 [Halotydeus destructor]